MSHEIAHPPRGGVAKPRNSLSQPGCRMETRSNDFLEWNRLGRRPGRHPADRPPTSSAPGAGCPSSPWRSACCSSSPPSPGAPSAAPDDIANAASGPSGHALRRGRARPGRDHRRARLQGPRGLPGPLGLARRGRSGSSGRAPRAHSTATCASPATATEGTHTATFSRVDRAAALKVKAGHARQVSRSSKTAPVVTRDRSKVRHKSPGERAAVDQPRCGRRASARRRRS